MMTTFDWWWWLFANPILGAFSGWCFGRAVVATVKDMR